MRIDGVEVPAGDWDAVCEDLLWWWHAHVCLYSRPAARLPSTTTECIYFGFGLDLESLPDFVTVYIAEYKLPRAMSERRRMLAETAQSQSHSWSALPYLAYFPFNPLVQGAYVLKEHTNERWNSWVVPWMHRAARRAHGHFCCVVWLLLRKLLCYTSLLEPAQLLEDTVQIIVAQVLLQLEDETHVVMHVSWNPGYERLYGAPQVALHSE